MSIIVTGIEMPESCFSCDFLKLSELCICTASHKTFERKQEYTKKRHEDCLLKSTEGLIEKIESEKYQNESGLAPAGKAMREWNRALDCCIKTIEEYCGMEG